MMEISSSPNDWIKARLSEMPAYGSPEFWHYIKKPQVPLEVLAHLYRYGPYERQEVQASDRQQLLEQILLHCKPSNHRWASFTVHKYCTSRSQEYTMLAEDLLADLEEEICRLFLETKQDARFFWNIRFMKCLSFARRRVRRTFLVREGHWSNPQVTRGRYIPRNRLSSIDDLTHTDKEKMPFDIEDESVRNSLLNVELSDLSTYVEQLPLRQRDIIEHIFWQGYTEKATAQQLGISDRTVRNQLQRARIHLSHTLRDMILPD